MWAEDRSSLQNDLAQYENTHANLSSHQKNATPITQSHISPPFKSVAKPKFESQTQVTTHSSVLSLNSDAKEPVGSVWTKDFRATVSFGTHDTKGVTKSPGSEKEESLRMTIHPLTGKPFPQFHRFVLSNPTDNVFMHWKHNCTPFNFRTVVQELNWTFPQTAGDPLADAFETFGLFMMDRVRETASFPSRYKASLKIDLGQGVATLSFFEVTNQYRNVELISLDFTASSWDEIKLGLRHDFLQVKEHHKQVKSALIQVLDIIGKHQPALLLNDIGMNDVHSAHPKRWQNLLNFLLPDSVQVPPLGRLVDDDKINRRKQEFAIMTQSTEVDIEPLLTKTVPIMARFDSEEGSKEAIRRLTFTFYGKGDSQSPSAYYIRVTDPDDIFFHYTSSDITPERFDKITKNLGSTRYSGINGSDVPISKPTQLDQILNPNPVPANVEKSRFARLGFHPGEGIGGVLGVIAGDFLTGVEQHPERYRGMFHVLENPKRKLQSTDRGPLSMLPEKKESEPSTKKNTSPMREFVRDHFPTERNAKLTFYERVHFRTDVLLQLQFKETDRWLLQEEVQRHYSVLRSEAEACHARLDNILNSAKKKNYALLSLISNVSIPSGFSSTGDSESQKLVTRKQVLTQTFVFPSPEKDGPAATRLLTYTTGLDLPDLIPARTSSPMRIPIQVPVKPVKPIKGKKILKPKPTKVVPTKRYDAPFAALRPYQVETGDWR